MKKINYKLRKILSIMMIVFLCMGSLAPGCFADANKRYAKVADVSGTVILMKSGGEREFKAFNGMSVSEGDRIKTGIASGVTLQVDETKTVKIGDNTTLDVADLKGSLSGGGKTSMQLWGGKVVVSITKKLGNDEKFDIKTPTAIMGVRGTLLFAGQNGPKTDLAVLEGSVATMLLSQGLPPQGNADSGAGGQAPPPSGEILVNANQGVSFDAGTQSPRQVRPSEITKPETLDLLALEAIQAEPQRVNPELLKNIDEIIKQKQIEQQKLEQQQLEQQQQQQQELLQETPLGAPPTNPGIQFSPEPPANVDLPGTTPEPVAPPTPNDPTGSTDTGTGAGTASRDHDHDPTPTVVTPPVTPPVTSLVILPMATTYVTDDIIGQNTMVMFSVTGTPTNITVSLNGTDKFEFLMQSPPYYHSAENPLYKVIELRALDMGAATLTITATDSSGTVTSNIALSATAWVSKLNQLNTAASDCIYTIGTGGDITGYDDANRSQYLQLMNYPPGRKIMSKAEFQGVITSTNAFVTGMNSWAGQLASSNWIDEGDPNALSGHISLPSTATAGGNPSVCLTYTSSTVPAVQGISSGAPSIPDQADGAITNVAITRPIMTGDPNCSLITATATVNGMTYTKSFKLCAPMGGPITLTPQ